MKLRMESREVYYLADATPSLRLPDLKRLLSKAGRSPRKRARYCLHQSVKDRVHEMIVAVLAKSYIAPHRHVEKRESYHVIAGRADLVIFKNTGEIEQVIPMGDPLSGKAFIGRTPLNQYHCFLLRSKSFIFHEVTNGPFKRSQTIRAPWAPVESDGRLAQTYGKSLEHRVDQFLNNRRR